MPLLNVPFRLSRTQAICCGLFLTGGAFFLACEINGEPLEVVSGGGLSDLGSVHSHAFVRVAGTATADELSRSGWADEYAFHLCDAKEQGMGLSQAMTYARNRSLQGHRAEAYPLELRQKAYAIAAERHCGA